VLAPRGGTHTRGAVLEDRLNDLPADLARRWYGIDHLPERGSWANVERLVIHQERVNAVWDALGICFFTSSGRPDMLVLEEVAELVSAALGRAISVADFLRVGERIQTQERSINRLLGLSGRSGDQPPRHFVEVALAGRYRIELDRWNAALDRYYAVRGWDVGTGWPTGAVLHQLGLDELSARLEALDGEPQKEKR
jgi:aldehyde:ferredoxin oxidoreductase